VRVSDQDSGYTMLSADQINVTGSLSRIAGAPPITVRIAPKSIVTSVRLVAVYEILR